MGLTLPNPHCGHRSHLCQLCLGPNLPNRSHHIPPQSATTALSPSSQQALLCAGCFTPAPACSAPSQGLRHLIAVSPEHQGHLSPTLGTPQHLTLPLPRHNTARDSQTEGAFGTSSTTALLPIAEQSPPLLPAFECLQTLGPAQTEGQQQGSCFGVARKCPACPAACLHCSSSQAPGLELWLEKSLPEALLAAGAKASQGWSQVRVGHALCATAPQQTRQDWVPDAGPALH